MRLYAPQWLVITLKRLIIRAPSSDATTNVRPARIDSLPRFAALASLLMMTCKRVNQDRRAWQRAPEDGVAIIASIAVFKIGHRPELGPVVDEIRDELLEFFDTIRFFIYVQERIQAASQV